VEIPSDLYELEREVANSWQVEHPVISGVASGLVLGAWPREFGTDVVTKPALRNVMNQGLGLSAFEYSRSAAREIFVRWRAVGAVISVALLLSVVTAIVRRRLRRD
jgi:heme A synthase